MRRPDPLPKTRHPLPQFPALDCVPPPLDTPLREPEPLPCRFLPMNIVRSERLELVNLRGRDLEAALEGRWADLEAALDVVLSPDWFASDVGPPELRGMGGDGLLDPGRTPETRVRLRSGASDDALGP